MKKSITFAAAKLETVRWMSGLVNGLQNRQRRFESATHLKAKAANWRLLSFLWCDAYPVGIQPPTVGLRIGLCSYKSKLRTYPLALAHSEFFTAVSPFLVVQAIGKVHNGLAAVRLSGLGIGNGKAQVDVLVDARLVVCLVLCRGLQGGYDVLRLGLPLVGVLAGHLNQLELLAYAADN